MKDSVLAADSISENRKSFRLIPAITREIQFQIVDAVKRGIDVLAAIFLLAFLLPIMLIVALLVKLTSEGPVLYSQKRLTDGNKIFTMYKFRTMRCDAESGTGAVWAQQNDPRVTPIGAFMRKTRLDELPQLLNVVIGDMSLIGPRPERPEIAKQLAEELPEMKRRLAVKAGLTGLAQVQAGYAADAEDYKEKLRWDINYIENRSLRLDLRIALRTIKVILTGFGAR